MNNHYHLVIETPEANLSKGMRQLNGIYTQRYNRRHRTVGHVFQGSTRGGGCAGSALRDNQPNSQQVLI
ncbi:MAG: hypothetical protein OJF50_005209 [Nitrospira sp.]|jgi:REP element-mobilizing transposase RayT|nr:hypothetical protein [Nitrospira sp.]